MSIKLRIIKENKVNKLNEKTYTIGDTQYWKRGDKYYSWTASGGRREISNNEYLKALQNNSTNVKNTTLVNDKSKDATISDRKSNQLPDGYGVTAPTGVSFEVLSDTSKKDISNKDLFRNEGVVSINGVNYEKFRSRGGTNSRGIDANYLVPTNKSPTTVWDLTGDKSGTVKKYDKAKRKNISNPSIIDTLAKSNNLNFNDVEEVYMGDHGYEYYHKGKSLGFYDDKKGTLTKTIEEPKGKTSVERDDTESDYINYDGVKDFDHTSWSVGGYNTQISRNHDSDGKPLRGYYLQNEDFDMEFDTKGDLVKYLKDQDAEFYGYDSENDY